MSVTGRLACALMLVLLLAAGRIDHREAAPPAASPNRTARPLPPPVEVRQEPEGVTLDDPAFEPLPGARADFGRLGGAVYQIEMPRHWNGRLVLFMHGYEELGPKAHVTAPDARRYLIGRGVAWGASSFSSTSQIPGRAADETAALWDFFATTYGRPTWTYVTGLSMGGAASHIAAERYADRFDGALGLCGSAGVTEGLMDRADYFAAAAYVTGVLQADFDASTDIFGLVRGRILPALQDPAVHERFENILLDVTGGPRPFAREGFEIEEDLNWSRTELAVAARLAPNRDTRYRLGPRSGVTSDEFNRAAVRLPIDESGLRAYVGGGDTTGALEMPLLSLHTTGDGQVPIEQARILQRRVDAAGKGSLLVQRVIRDAGHCGFRTTEWEAAYEALVRWVEHGVKPTGIDVLTDDLGQPARTFELAPRPGTPEADIVRGAADRAALHGRVTLDGAPFDATYLGAVVRRRGLISNCQYTLSRVDNGRYKVIVAADAEADGCGARGAQIVLWTFAENQILYSAKAVAWPGNGRTRRFDTAFATSAPDGAAAPMSGFVGEVFDRHGRHVAPGTRVEAYVGDTRCGVASTRRTGSFSGYSLVVVGPDSVRGCRRGAALTFRIDGRLALDTAVNEPRAELALDLTLR